MKLLAVERDEFPRRETSQVHQIDDQDVIQSGVKRAEEGRALGEIVPLGQETAGSIEAVVAPVIVSSHRQEMRFKC